MAFSEIKILSTGMLAWMAPEVPNLKIFNFVNFSFNTLWEKSIFTKASNSLSTISILSVPIPVEITLILLFL